MLIADHAQLIFTAILCDIKSEIVLRTDTVTGYYTKEFVFVESPY
jgi:hypothetical protein